MLAGIKFSQLSYGDPLINKNWTYKNLWGLFASQQKLADQFQNANELGFTIIYDSIKPIYNNEGKLTLENVGHNSDLWPLYDSINHQDRISFYKQQILANRFKFICQVEFPEAINSNNMSEYVEFFNKLITNPDFSWIEDWQIGDYPEQLIYNPALNKYLPKISPENYVSFLNRIRTSAKIFNPNIKIGGPGLYKCLALLDPNNYLHGDTTFYHDWLPEAIEKGLLYNLDFFTVQLKQETKGLDYDNISNITFLLKELISETIGSSVQIYSINQGRQELNKNSIDLLKDQSYYNISEMLNTAKSGVIPILNGIIDPPSDIVLNPSYDPKDDGYGIFKFDMSKKPIYEVLKFIMYQLKDFSMLTIPNKIYNNIDADNISFINNSKDDIVSIVWSKNKKQNTIVILPNPDQYGLFVDGSRHKIINPFEFETSIDFIVVTQHLNLKLLDYDDIKSTIFKKYMYSNNYKNSLLKSLPFNYNVDVDDTNFYKILRAIALEFADAQIQVDLLDDNAYLDTAHKDAIYQNFGTLVNLERQSNWDYEKYRRLIKGVIKSLLSGPTLKSIQEAINLFINYESIFGGDVKIADIKIHELYEDKTLDPTMYDGVYPQFAFLVEVAKNIDIGMDQEYLNRDLKYIINLLKPAHTLSFVVIVLSGNEDYKKWYYENHFNKDGLNIEFKDSDEMKMDIVLGGNNGRKEGIYGWKHLDYHGSFYTFNPDKTQIYSKTNSGILIGPRYILYDNNYEDIYLEKSEVMKKVIEDNGDVIRFGYYNDNQDDPNNPLDPKGGPLDPKQDNPIKLNERWGKEDLNFENPDYGNPDSGEYYKNWWMKYHKIVNDNVNKVPLTNWNIQENRKYQIVLEKDTSKFNRNIYFDNTVYPDIPRNSILVDPNMFSDNNPPEIKILDRHNIINNITNEIEVGNLPYNNIIKRAIRIENSDYKTDEIPKSIEFHFEDMDEYYNFDFGVEELKFGVSPFIFQANEHLLPTTFVPIGNIHSEYQPIGLKYSVTDTMYFSELEKSISEDFKNPNEILTSEQSIDKEETFIIPNIELDINPDILVDEFIPEQLNYSMFKLNVSVLNSKDTLLNDIVQDTTAEMYKIINGNKITITPLTTIF